MAVTAQGSQATLFIQINNQGGDVGSAHLNSGHIDNFKFEEAPVADISLPAQATAGTVNASWNASIPAPSPWSLWGYDVEFKDHTTNIWQTLQTHDGGNNQNSNHAFTGEAGKTYSLRVRPWMQWGSGDAATSAMPGMWQEKSVTIGGAVTGRAMNHMGLGLNNVTVGISGTTTSGVSMNGGQYFLPTGAGTFEVGATDTAGLVAPPVASVSVPNNTSNGRLDIMLRPAGSAQALTNNDFEADLTGWSATGNAAQSGLDSHTGQGSLAIFGTATISQTGNLMDTFNPVLSFWYKSDAPFTASLVGSNTTLPGQPLSELRSVSLPATGEWTHTTLDLNSTGVYSGSIGAQFSYDDGGSPGIFIDEVSLAAGPRRTFLPVVVKN